MPEAHVIIEIIGEGKTDRGPMTKRPTVEPPGNGVLSNLVHALCDFPASMRVRALPMPYLQKGGFDRKLEFAKREASYRRSSGQTHGLVFVIDTEGDFKKAHKEVTDGRDRRYTDLPTAIGVAHPCIEAWLLSDGAAIRQALKLPGDPAVPDDPESLPAPCKDRARNPKTVLASCAGRTGELTVSEKTAIAARMRDTALICSRCTRSFAPFADQVARHIKPLFGAGPDGAA